MPKLSRIGVSIDSILLADFDRLIGKMGYPNRSEAFRDLIRNKLVAEQQELGIEQCVGVISLVYNHHRREISDRIVDMQHELGKMIVASVHIHLDEDNCLEVIIVTERAKKVKEVADRLMGTKGVKHGKLAITSTGKDLI
jgi:CopG family nickel-responsive transcriptional regulator